MKTKQKWRPGMSTRFKFLKIKIWSHLRERSQRFADLVFTAIRSTPGWIKNFADKKIWLGNGLRVAGTQRFEAPPRGRVKSLQRSFLKPLSPFV
jgi:hypothetical protein